MNKQEILNQLRRYQKQCSTTETIMAFGAAIALVEQLDENEKQGPERWVPKFGEYIFVRDFDDEVWSRKKFIKMAHYGAGIMCEDSRGNAIYWSQYKRIEE